MVIWWSHRDFSKPCVEKIFQNLCVRLKFNTRSAMKIKLFVAREIQYFKLGIFSFNSYVYYVTRGFIASTRAFNPLTRAFNLPTRAFSLPTRAFNLTTRAFSVLTREFELVTRRFELVTHEFKLVTGGFELVTCRFELLTRGFKLVTRNSFHGLTNRGKHRAHIGPHGKVQWREMKFGMSKWCVVDIFFYYIRKWKKCDI